MLVFNSMYAFLALGVTFVIITGGIDLSISSVAVLSSMLAAWFSRFDLLPAIFLTVFIATLIGLFNGWAVFFLPGWQQAFFAWDGPDIVDRRVNLRGNAGYKGRAPFRLGAHGGSIGAVNVNLAIKPGLLRIADQDLPDGAALELDDCHGGVFNLDKGMVEIIPITKDLRNGAYQPLEDIALVDGLVD